MQTVNTNLMPLVALRHRAGFTQDEVAEVIGKSRSTVALWERDASSISMREAEELAALYHYPREGIFFGSLQVYITQLAQQ